MKIAPAIVFALGVVALAAGVAGGAASRSTNDAPQSMMPSSPREFFGQIMDLPADNVRDALDDAERPASDRAHDPAEKVEEILRASGIARGMRVGDLQAGDGYLSQLLPTAVKRFGHVWANNDPAALDPTTAKAWKSRLEDPSASDIARLDLPLAEPFPAYAGPLEIVFSRDAYHDAVARGIDRAKMNASVFSIVSPGGKYVVVDARARADETPEVAARRCRSPEGLVRAEVEAAGFRLVTSSTVLNNASDSTAASACGNAAASKSVDRYLLVFAKPGA